MAWTEEQKVAINESGKNIIVSAGAGSGKTAVLTARTMRLIEDGVHINEMLILTFTKAAAGEMKDRIRKKIKDGISSNPSLKNELELVDQSYITTFDSFALSVVKKYHYLLNISNDIKISDASVIDLAKKKIMDEVFDKYYSDNNDKFNSLIYDFCVKDDDSIKKDILNIADKIDAMTNRDEYLDNYDGNFLNDDFFNKGIDEYRKKLEECKNDIKSKERKLHFYIEGDYEEKINSVLVSVYNASSIKDIIVSVNNCRLPNLPKGSSDEIKQYKEELKVAIDNLKEVVNTYGDDESIKKGIDKSKNYIGAIIEIIKEYLKRLHDYKKEKGLYDFQDIALLSIDIVKKNDDVRKELKGSFKQIMIDEYQDTNDIQENFISMIENNNVYMVGDIKQSIYRFRNANPYIFKSKYDKYAKNDGGLKIDLVKNFRSREEVLSNINEIFNYIMDNSIGGAEYHESHRMVFGNTSYIEEGKTKQDYNMEILEYPFNSKESNYTKEEIEIFTIANDIEEKINSKYQVFDKDDKILRDITYNDFVILLDRTTDFDLYKKIFEYKGIPLNLYKDDSLNNSNDIFILKNIIDLLIKINKNEYDQSFKYDFISIARSYLYEKSDKDIFNIFVNNSFKESDIYSDMKSIALEINSLSIREIIERIVSVTKLYEKMIKVGNINDGIIRISKILDLTGGLGDLGYNIFSFNDYLKDLLSNGYEMKYSTEMSTSEAVKIMTIHKSKGLEYHICYFSGLYKKFNISDIKARFMLDNKYGIIAPYFEDGIKDVVYKYLAKCNYVEEEISEKIRLFYVALTRAKEKMIMLLPSVVESEEFLEDNGTIELGVRKKYQSMADMINSIKSKIIKYYKEVNIEKIGISKDYLFNKKKEKNLKDDKVNSLEVKEIAVEEKNNVLSKSFSKKNNKLLDKNSYNNINYGLKIHEALEYIDFISPKYELIEDEKIREKIKKFINNPLFNNFKNVKIYKEYEFMYKENNNIYHGIIDLLLEYQDKIFIIDYKLSDISDEKYLEQLKGYKNYISKISNKLTITYLYSIMNENLEEI